MAAQAKTKLNVVFGAMTFGKEGTEQARVHDLETCGQILDIFRSHGHAEVDTARLYCGGTSEQYLGELKWQERGLIMQTKLYPTGNWLNFAKELITHKPEDLRRHLKVSLKELQTDKLDIWYLHGPDRTTPYEETLREVDRLYREGHFRRFGISNYMSWEVAEMCEIADRNGWVKPSVYQGMYNGLHRAVEAELFPCLRKYGIAFYAFNPLAGGFLTDRYHRETKAEEDEGSRFDPNKIQGKSYRARYWNEEFFDALDIVRPAAKKFGLTEAECALRWMMHHSQLSKERGDSVIIGASSPAQLESNLKDFEKGPLPEEVVQAFEAGWGRTRGVAWKYWH